ncbi:hypothetical protein TWF718_007903 [Orbilia javanica]|uniref:C2H2-type domain-containing protein n=1 Tax=Orbilia javanica TaxID=47235 RepID=A0AAN8MMC3_9PEZI
MMDMSFDSVREAFWRDEQKLFKESIPSYATDSDFPPCSDDGTLLSAYDYTNNYFSTPSREYIERGGHAPQFSPVCNTDEYNQTTIDPQLLSLNLESGYKARNYEFHDSCGDFNTAAATPTTLQTNTIQKADGMAPDVEGSDQRQISPIHTLYTPLTLQLTAEAPRGYSQRRRRYVNRPQLSGPPRETFRCGHSGCTSEFANKASLAKNRNSKHTSNEVFSYFCLYTGCKSRSNSEVEMRARDNLSINQKAKHSAKWVENTPSTKDTM